MDPKQNVEVLELYTNGLSIEALKDAEKFLESCLPLNRGVTKERLLEKVLYEEQQIEYSRKVAENLRKEHEELLNKATLHGQKLQSVEVMRAELDELRRKRKEEDVGLSDSYRSMDEIIRMKQETEELREECSKLRAKWDAEQQKK